MVHPEIDQFCKACMIDYAESRDIPWNLDPEDGDVYIDSENEFYGYYDPSIYGMVRRYIEYHQPILRDCFEENKNIITTRSQFIYFLLVSVVGWKFRNGYSHKNFLRFLAWLIFLAFRFFEIGKRDFPQAAMYVLSETLEYFIEKSWVCSKEEGFQAMAAEASAIEWKLLFSDSLRSSLNHTV